MLRSGLIATKIGNSSYFQEDGKNTHVTVLKVDECIVAGIKTSNKDGYNAVQLTSVETNKDISHINKPQRKIFSSIKIMPLCRQIFWKTTTSPSWFLTTNSGKPRKLIGSASPLFGISFEKATPDHLLKSRISFSF